MSSRSLFLKPVRDKFRIRVDVDLPQLGFSNVGEAVRRACRNRDNVSGSDFKFSIANRAPSPAFLNNDYLVIIMPVKWNFASRRRADTQNRVTHAIVLAA